MLSSFLSQLQSYFSKYFVIGSFCPVLAFAFINGLTAYMLSGRWRAWVDPYIIDPTVARAAFMITSLTVAIVLAAYVLSSLSTFLRRMLEGRWWEPLAKLFIPTQNRRRDRLFKDVQNAAITNVDLVEVPKWVVRLVTARQAGVANPAATKFKKCKADPIEELIKGLEDQRLKNEVVSSDDLSKLVDDFEVLLQQHNANLGTELNRQHQRITFLIDYATERAKAHYARLVNQLHASYGSEEVAATRMGNIANTIQGYALRRYNCNLEVIWSNLQRVAQRDDKTYAALQEAKTQLDFLVACCWLTLLWSLIWAVVFAAVAQSQWGFLVAALGGPLLAYVWYRAATEQYRSFADVAMTTLDSFRLDLLDEMRLAAPADVEGERYVWESLNLLSTYGEERNFRYERPKRAQT
jgi:hypothetical protein